MNYNLYNKSKKITFDKLRKFIESELNENEYFCCNKENLISLKEYITELKLKKQKYSDQIKEQLHSIQQKNKWVTDIQPSFNWPSVDIKVEAKNYPSIGIGRVKEDGKLEMTSELYSVFLTDSIIYRRIKNRKKIISNSQEELKEIEKIINNFNFLNEKEGIISVSENFVIRPNDLDTIDIFTNKRRFFHINLNDDESYLFKDSKNILLKNYSKRLINKIQIKK